MIFRVFWGILFLMEPEGVTRFVDETACVGLGSFIWHFTIVLADVEIGHDCNIGGRCEIGRGTVVGDRTRIGSGTFLPPNSVVGNDVFIGPNVTCTDDRWPKCSNANYKAEPPTIEDGASIGAGVVLLPGVHIGRGAMIGAGSVVTRDVPPNTVVRGEPAQQRYLLDHEE